MGSWDTGHRFVILFEYKKGTGHCHLKPSAVRTLAVTKLVWQVSPREASAYMGVEKAI